ncbi:hypothetical protein ABZ557_11715 [Streptomyces sp. NPDC019645]|uniref:hypothetical protein n=1 Tax=Streptomyces sp. NPDC019645 TaxID=3154786 RepID=UPI0033F5B10A
MSPRPLCTDWPGSTTSGRATWTANRPATSVPAALYGERSLLPTPRDGELAIRTGATWEEVAGRPLCLLSPQMQNRRILDRNVADAGVRADASMETDTVSPCTPTWRPAVGRV